MNVIIVGMLAYTARWNIFIEAKLFFIIDCIDVIELIILQITYLTIC